MTVELNGFSDSFNKSLDGIDYTLPAEELRAAIFAAANADAGGAAEKLINTTQALRKEKQEAASLKNSESASEAAIRVQLEEELLGFQTKELIDAKNYTEASEKKDAQYQKYMSGKDEEIKGKDLIIHGLVVGNALTAELVNLDVHKDLMPDLQVAIASRTKVVDGRAMVGEDTLAEYMEKWKDTPAGKASCVAPINSGGNGLGGDATTQTRSGKSDFAGTKNERINAAIAANPLLANLPDK